MDNHQILGSAEFRFFSERAGSKSNPPSSQMMISEGVSKLCCVWQSSDAFVSILLVFSCCSFPGGVAQIFVARCIVKFDHVRSQIIFCF
jgi:hypothetical protein